MLAGGVCVLRGDVGHNGIGWDADNTIVHTMAVSPCEGCGLSYHPVTKELLTINFDPEVGYMPLAVATPAP